MFTIAYLANQFTAAVEPYVGEEIQELRRRGVRVLPGSVRRPDTAHLESTNALSDPEMLCLQPLRVLTLLRALGLILRRWKCVARLAARILLRGKESPKLRLKALLHTWLGAYYAVLLRERDVDHIHAHHGYFGSWIAMVASRLLDVSFSLTLHGSDLLLDGAYLGTKLKNCSFCITISEYNRRYVLEHFPALDPRKIVVSRLGVDAPADAKCSQGATRRARRTFTLLAVGRLHAVKDYAFLVRACARLSDSGLDFDCVIAGEGPERQHLEWLIRQNRLQDRLTLLGHVPRPQMGLLYQRADVVVLTSRSEGIPLVLMEAMARGRIVLAPAITGIPEIVIPGKTGFLYAPGSLQDFVAQIASFEKLMRSEDRLAVSELDWIRHAARVQILHNFRRSTNLSQFADRFLQLIATQGLSTQDFANRNFASRDLTTQDLTTQDLRAQNWSLPHEDTVLQQV
ncbi:MAG: glycosyltransferase [Candidatus Sulfotelmatobacter sp.]